MPCGTWTDVAAGRLGSRLGRGEAEFVVYVEELARLRFDDTLQPRETGDRDVGEHEASESSLASELRRGFSIAKPTLERDRAVCTRRTRSRQRHRELGVSGNFLHGIQSLADRPVDSVLEAVEVGVR